MNGLEVVLLLALATVLLTVSWLLATAREDEWSAWVGSVRRERDRLAALGWKR